MFTGIVEELGTVVSREGPRLRIAATTVLDDVELGASIAVNGTCLTVVELGRRRGLVGGRRRRRDLRPHRRSARCEPGHPVNLERPVRLSDRLGGHLVQGHVDGVGEIVDRRARPAGPHATAICCATSSRRAPSPSTASASPSSTLHDDGFTVAVIPHTMEVTTLGHKGPGDLVNLEVDVTAKYVERLLAWKDA